MIGVSVRKHSCLFWLRPHSGSLALWLTICTVLIAGADLRIVKIASSVFVKRDSRPLQALAPITHTVNTSGTAGTQSVTLRMQEPKRGLGEIRKMLSYLLQNLKYENNKPSPMHSWR